MRRAGRGRCTGPTSRSRSSTAALLIAANVYVRDAMRVIENGLAAQGFEPQVPADIESPRRRSEIVAGHCGMLDAEQAGTLVAAQAARDQFMARA